MALFKKPTQVSEAPQIPTTSTTSEPTPEPTQVPQQPEPPQDSDRARRLAALGYR